MQVNTDLPVYALSLALSLSLSLSLPPSFIFCPRQWRCRCFDCYRCLYPCLGLVYFFLFVLSSSCGVLYCGVLSCVVLWCVALSCLADSAFRCVVSSCLVAALPCGFVVVLSGGCLGLVLVSSCRLLLLLCFLVLWCAVLSFLCSLVLCCVVLNCVSLVCGVSCVLY
jgi:hypothetical protein